ncbi:transposase-like protein [Salinibacter ruber]|nr:transposase-like protein [Salinibacter ruber]
MALMETVVQGINPRRVKKITIELCVRQFAKSIVSTIIKWFKE